MACFVKMCDLLVVLGVRPADVAFRFVTFEKDLLEIFFMAPLALCTHRCRATALCFKIRESGRGLPAGYGAFPLQGGHGSSHPFLGRDIIAAL